MNVGSGYSTAKNLELDSVPGLPRIYKDYILDFDRVRELYARDYRNVGKMSAPSAPCRSGVADRAALKGVLLRQMEMYSGDRSVRENIEVLCGGGCAVVTGQQIGLFGGPLYTICKAATAIRLVEELRKNGTGEHVPVFWMECEDHDIMEVGRVSVVDRTHQVLTHNAFQDPSRRSTGAILVDARVEQLLAKVTESLQGSEHLDYALGSLRECYQIGAPLSLAFAKLLSAIFRGKGLVIVDPTDRELKRIGRAVLLAAVHRWGEANNALLESSRRLFSMGYEPQIDVTDERPPFMLLRDGERFGLSWKDGAFVDGAGARTSPLELVTLIGEKPETLSPNVSLRPILQDYLLFTDTYVAGPAEVAYFAQVAPLYEIFDLDMPAIFPRAQFTMIEPVVRRALERLNVEISELKQDEQSLLEKHLARTGAVPGLEALRRAGSRLDEVVDELARELLKDEAQMSRPLETYRKKTEYQFTKLEEKLKALYSRKNDVIARQIKTARNHLFPLGKPQERVLNTCYYASQIGEGLADTILTHLDPFDFRHRIIDI